jgi:RHS repeat-associated protein
VSHDAAGNLSWRTNNGVESAFTVDSKNQLSTDPNWSYTYDANGNIGYRTAGSTTEYYSWDNENRLVSLTYGTSYRSDFTYDGLGRMRQRIDYSWTGSSWYPNGTTTYFYDGMRVIQERLGGSPTVSYTRGTDLSGTLEGAGGIGGPLARSSSYVSGTWTNHNFYHADGNGNITYLESASQGLAASYRYDPFGNTLYSSGTLASANTYRFSSKEIHPNSGIYYYLYRFYDPNLQRWLNRDPLGEAGGLNLYAYCLNSPLNFYDPDGLLGTPAENLALILAIGPEEAAEILGISVEAAKAIALAGATMGSKCDTKAWQHESPNPDKTKKRGDHKNRPDGKRDRDPQPKPPEKPPQPPPKPPYDGPPKDGGPPRPRPGR